MNPWKAILFLRGRLPSYYHKQLAQEAVAKLGEVEQVVKEIEVVSAATCPRVGV